LKSGTGLIGPVLRNQDLGARIADAIAAARDFAALPCSQTFARWNTSMVIAGAGGNNVLCVGDVALNGGKVVTLSGGANDTFIVNVTGRFALTGGSKIVASGVPQSVILYNVLGPGQQVALNGPGGGVNCCSTSLDGTVLALGRTIALAPGLVSGEVIGGQNIGIIGGASVH
jgi:putative adhesin